MEIGEPINVAVIVDEDDEEEEEIPLLRMHLDYDRDGNVDDDVARSHLWQWGRNGTGAVIFCNNDDDDFSGDRDNSDATVNGGHDRRDIVRLVLRRDRAQAFPGGWTATLSVNDEERIRIFDAYSPAGNEIIGPTTADSYEIPDIGPQEIEYAMEATQHANADWQSGLVRITLQVRDDRQLLRQRQTARVRVAPWMMPSHLDAAETVYVVNAGGYNSRFRGELATHVGNAGCALVQHAAHDVWMQDCMEIGYSSMPNQTIHSVLRAPRDRPLRSFPITLMGREFGYITEGTMASYTTFDSTGNLENAPPPQRPVRGKEYPWGRIYYGPGRSGERMDSRFAQFLRWQRVQRPFTIDTAWLSVGHVDEIVSFVPAPGAPGFKLLVASPALARNLLESIPARARRTTRMMIGRSFPVYDEDGNFDHDEPAEIDVHSYLRNAQARAFNHRVQGRLNNVTRVMCRNLGIPDARNDVIELPVLYTRTDEGFADALTAGVVNMLVINNHCIVPKPFGPVVAGVDLFEQHVEQQLQPLGLTVEFLDDWDEYHVALGEVHCGTNTKRTLTPAPWWEFDA